MIASVLSDKPNSSGSNARLIKAHALNMASTFSPGSMPRCGDTARRRIPDEHRIQQRAVQIKKSPVIFMRSPLFRQSPEPPGFLFFHDAPSFIGTENAENANWASPLQSKYSLLLRWYYPHQVKGSKLNNFLSVCFTSP
jgi:hypothetical protein